MTCCFTPGGVLTRAEREAIARLREQRAAGNVPRAVAHPAVRENTDTLVSFYSNKSAAGGARQCARKAKKAAEKRVRRFRVSGRVAVKRVSAKAAAKQAHAKGGSKAPVVREGARGGSGTRAPVVDAIKAMTMWHALKREQQQQQRDTAHSSHDADRQGDRERHVARIKDATRKRFEEMRSRIAGGGWGDRFTARQKVDESDLNEANNDRYFQELMSAER